VLRTCGCAIVAANERLAPADRRLYAIRDVTATVASVPLITASILSKKLAAGLQSLVMDVKVGNGAFCTDRGQAQTLAYSLVTVAAAAGLPTVALLTDMQQPLGRTAGNALEVREATDFLKGLDPDPRLREVTLALGEQALVQAGLAHDETQARRQLEDALSSGAAAQRWAAMVAGLGGPADVLRDACLPTAPVVVDVPASAEGWIAAIDTRVLGQVVVELGGGRRLPGDGVDPRVGLDQFQPVGLRVSVGQPLCRIHAADLTSAQVAATAVLNAFRIEGPQPEPAPTAVVLGPAVRGSSDPPGPGD
jgi:thymidine phosphorylase